MEEEHVHEGGCSVVYFCASAQHDDGDDDVVELHHRDGPSSHSLSSSSSSFSSSHKAAVVAQGLRRHGHPALRTVRANVRALLDEDRGGFDEVFVGSRPERCLERLESCANRVPTVVLVELRNHHSSSSHSSSSSSYAHTSPGGPLKDNQKHAAFPFLRALAADVRGARYQKRVMPFAVLAFDNDDDDDDDNDDDAAAATADANPIVPDGPVASSCLGAGALDILCSPFGGQDVDRLVGHVAAALRPPARLVGNPMAQSLVDSVWDMTAPRLATHRPDETLTAERKAAVEAAIRHWHFPARDFDMDELTYAALFMLEHILSVPALAAYGLSRPRLVSFLLATRRQYKHENEVFYHNWRHAVDVTQSLYCFLLDVRICPPLDDRIRRELGGVERALTPLDGLILLVSAIGHDVGHPGVNNAFLVACNHPLAQVYNDKSVLENYHCAAFSQLLRRHWPSLSNIAGFRSTMISNILATDMQRHFEYMNYLADLKKKVDGSDRRVDEWGDKDREHARELAAALLMKAADISNVARPFDISAGWAKVLMDEFSRQGELESELQIPTCLFGGPPDKEDVLAAAQSQKGFMDLFGMPLFRGISELMPSVACSIQELDKNLQLWDQRIEGEKRKRTNAGGAGGETEHLTFTPATEGEIEESTGRHRASEPANAPIDVDAGAGAAPTTPVSASRVRIADREVVHAPTPTSTPPRQMIRPPRHRPPQLYIDDGGDGDRRPSGALLSIAGAPHSPSRRSSKDVALDSMRLHGGPFMPQNLSPSSRRGSADAGWHIHQSHPNSRRGSKDESLTTILVTSGGGGGGGGGGGATATMTPGQRSSPSLPSSPTKKASGPNSTLCASDGVPHSHSATATATTPLSPSSSAPNEPDPDPDPELDSPATSASAPYPSIPSTEDPFLVPGNWPNDPDGSRRVSSPEGLSLAGSPPPLPPPAASNQHWNPDFGGSTGSGGGGGGIKPEPDVFVTHVATGAGAGGDAGREDGDHDPVGSSAATSVGGGKDDEAAGAKAGPAIRQSRSRSRLRGLKFWKKKRDFSPPASAPAGRGRGTGAVDADEDDDRRDLDEGS